MNRSLTHTLAFAVFLLLPFCIMKADTDSNKPVRHVVVFRFSDDATEKQIESVTEGFRKMMKTIPGITDFEHGLNDSPENLNRGLTHVYLLTFENAAARDHYLPHPDHKAFGKMLGELGIFEEVFVVDYAPQK